METVYICIYYIYFRGRKV